MKAHCQPCPHTYTTGKAKGGPAFLFFKKNVEEHTRVRVVETSLCHLTWASMTKVILAETAKAMTKRLWLLPSTDQPASHFICPHTSRRVF